MFNQVNRGDVSNKLIFGLGAGIVLLVLMVPLLFALVPRFKKLLNHEVEKLELVQRENFEGKLKSIGPGMVSIPIGWNTISYYQQQVQISSKTFKLGRKSLYLTSMGQPAAIYQPLRRSAQLPMVIECDVRLDGRASSAGSRWGGRPQPAARALISIAPLQKCRNIRRFSGPYPVVWFGKDKCVHCGLSSPGKNTHFRWKPDKWYKLVIRLEETNKKWCITVSIDGKQIARIEDKAPQWADNWQSEKPQVILSSNVKSCYFDNLIISRVVKIK